MRNSLQRRISIWLGAVILATGLLAAAVSYWLAYDEAQEFQDNALRQIASLVDADTLPQTGQRFAKSADNDPESLIIVERLGAKPVAGAAHLDLPADLATGFHTLDVNGASWRLYVRVLQSGERIAVAQNTEVRAEAAQDGAQRTLLPLLALPVLIILARQLVRVSLAPVRALAHVADAQPEDRPAPLPIDKVPEEIAPFVHSINQLLERVNRLIAHQQRFIADAAHELRTPLTALSVQAQNLQHADSIEAVQERLAPLLTSLERMKHLTEQLLNLARTQSDITARTSVNVSHMVCDLIAEYLPLAEAKGIDLGMEEATPLTLHTSSEGVWLILRNGLENALKYTPEKGEVTFRLQVQEGDAIIDIIDNGPGIPPAEQERVFDPFYRIPGSTQGGSGLGLAIAQEVARRLGGRITLSARQFSPGLIFRFRQPMRS